LRYYGHGSHDDGLYPHRPVIRFQKLRIHGKDEEIGLRIDQAGHRSLAESLPGGATAGRPFLPDGDGTAHERDPDESHIGATGNEQWVEKNGHEMHQQADTESAVQRMHQAAEHDAAGGGQSAIAAARQ